jgi:photosystem II stability/assembly factor-like uncharacterized protein
MRHLTIIIFLFLTGAAFGADYIEVDLPTTATINQIYFFNDQLGWAATSDGEVLSTYDGGKTWRLSQVSKRNIRDIHFQNRVGYITGNRGLLMKTTNGGATWQDISMNIKYNFTGLGIVDDSTAIICGTDQNSMSKTKGEIFESRDYGKTWKKHDWRLGNGFVDLAVCPPRRVYLLAIKKVFHSISQGVRYFHGKYEGSRLAFGFDFMDEWGFMVGRKGYFAWSNTHGKKWEERELDLTLDLYAVEMFDRYSGVAVGEKGTVMYFYDDGQRQVLDNCGRDVDLRTLFITGNRIFLGGDNGLMMYKDRFPRSDQE